MAQKRARHWTEANAHGAACDWLHKLEQIVNKLRAAEAAEIVLRP